VEKKDYLGEVEIFVEASDGRGPSLNEVKFEKNVGGV